MKNTEEETPKCAVCGCNISSDDTDLVHMDGDLVHICHDCSDNETGKCSHCGERHLNTELYYTESGDLICLDCAEGDDFIYCDNCNKYAERYSAVVFNDEWWGRRCANKYLVECDDCGELVSREDTYYTANGNRICHECYESDYVTCEGCGCVIRTENAVERNNFWYCEDCAPSRNGIYEYHGFDSGEYRNKKKIDGENDNLYLGIELECDYGSFDMEDFKNYEEIHFEEDGSLSAAGVEMISLPMTLRYHQRFDWKNILLSLLEQGFKSHDTYDCGLHIHMSRWAIPATTIAKMDVFINRAKDFWTLIARRDHVYSGEYNSSKRLDFTRCIYNTSSRCPAKMADKIDYGMGYDRYTPVNVCNRATVEIRIFRGTLKYQTFMGSIEICHAVVNWLNTVPVTRIYYTEKLIQEFIEYIKHNKDRYPHVIPMLELRFRETRFEKLLKENSAEKISQ